MPLSVLAGSLMPYLGGGGDSTGKALGAGAAGGIIGDMLRG